VRVQPDELDPAERHVNTLVDHNPLVEHAINHVEIQIKGRWSNKKLNPGARVSKIDLTKSWDAVMLVLFDRMYEPVAIYEAPRDKITEVLLKPGSKSRVERGQMSISQFKAIAQRIWPEGDGAHEPKAARPHRPVRYKKTGVVYPTRYRAGKAVGPELLPNYTGKPSVIWFAMIRDHADQFELQNAAGAWVALDDPSLD